MKSYKTKDVLIHVYDATINPPFKRVYRKSHHKDFSKLDEVSKEAESIAGDIFSAMFLSVIYIIILFLIFGITI